MEFPTILISRSLRSLTLLLLLVPAGLMGQQRATTDTFSMEQVLSYPFPSDLIAAPAGGRIAWLFNQEGRRNIWMASPPGYKAVQVTGYTADDGQELTHLAFTPDGNTIVFVRGGDHDGNWDGDGAPNPASGTAEPKVRIFAVNASAGSTPRLLVEGDNPVISPRSDRVVFSRAHQLWVKSLNDTTAARVLFYARGSSHSAAWSPDGSRLAFVSDRDDHSFIGVYREDSTPIQWMAASTSRDFMPRWSPDGSRIAFIRIAGQGGAPETLLEETPLPWEIWIAETATGTGRRVWQSPNTLHGSYPETQGEANLHWAAGNRLVFLADLDGWPHLYSIATAGGEPLLLTPGNFMAEFISLSPDRASLVYSANTGTDADDDDRRHVFSVPADRAEPKALTPGRGNEWGPVITGDGRMVAYIGASATRPPLPSLIPAGGGEPRVAGSELVAASYPESRLVQPRKVVFTASDGTRIHGQIFAREDGAGRKPGVVFVHGGPPRQMLLGWHYSRYYSNAYAVNQYLANHGFVVLTVNYRRGIGYGHDFHHPKHPGPWGGSEYQDVEAAGRFLQAQANVDSSRIGIWGGSYGGLLTALALARNSDLFRTGVDIHGVHDWPTDMEMWETSSERRPYEPSDYRAAMDVAWKSSPVADIVGWKSPVLLIQGDDDRNVRFHQTVDLARRLKAQGVRFEELVIPDEIHDFLRHASWLKVDRATADWLKQELRPGSSSPSSH